ncbi:histidine kinase [Pseudonocardia sp.]|uniref:sensor histidine kinase n=1 Tax=Pseudonocardia sp. TaxID=60912 RepID=UPI0031FDE206
MTDVAGRVPPGLRIVDTGTHLSRSAGRHSRGEAGVEPAVRTSRIAVQYVVTALISVLVVALCSVWASRVVAADYAVDGAIAGTQLAADEAVAPVLTDAVLTGDPAALEGLDRAVREKVLNVSMVRVKIWDETGRILYSDEPALIGERFGLGANEIEALHGGAPDAEMSDLSAPENRLEDRSVPLLEVYLPLRTPGGVPVLFEAYSHYAGVTEATQQVWTRFIPLGVGALVLLELLQIPISAVLARRLRRAQVQREEMLRRTLTALEDERLRIAADLHDGVVQDLAGVAFALGAAARVGGPARVAPAQLAESADTVRRSVRALRSLLVGIYPPNLHAEGLPAALADLAARLVPPGTTSVLDVRDPLPRLRREQVELVFRVAQEGLRNVVRHAAASVVEIALGQDGGVLVLCVTDDGKGSAPDRRVASGHLGLKALSGLAAQHGAVLVLDSAPGRGTTLRLEVPL